MTNLDLHLAEALMAGAFTLVLRGPRVQGSIPGVSPRVRHSLRQSRLSRDGRDV